MPMLVFGRPGGRRFGSASKVLAVVLWLLNLAHGQSADKEVAARIQKMLHEQPALNFGERYMLELEHPGAAITPLLSCLSDKDASVRLWAAIDIEQILTTLGQDRGYFIRTRDIVLPLAKALSDTNAEVRPVVANALVQIGQEARDAVPALLISLKDPSPKVRNLSAQALGKIGLDSKEAVAAISDALSDSDVEVRKWAAADLQNSYSSYKSDAIPALVRRLNDEKDFATRDLVMGALASFWQVQDPKQVAPALLIALKDKSVPIRVRAAQNLQKYSFKENQVVTGLLLALKDQSPMVRCAAARSLPLSGNEKHRSISGLLEVTKDSNSTVRGCAVAVLGNSDAEEVVSGLIAALTDSDSTVRTDVVAALGHLGPRAAGAVPALTSELGSPDPLARKSACEALGSIGSPGKEATLALVASLRDPVKDVRKAAATALGLSGTDAKEVISALAASLKDPDAEVREASAAALGLLGLDAKDALQAITEAMNDPNASVRTAAAKSLGSLRNEAKKAIPTLISAAKESDATVRAAAVNALGEIGTDDKEVVVPTLIAAAKESDTTVQVAAVNALGEIGIDDKEVVVPTLLSALEDSDSEVRGQAAMNLAYVGLAPEDRAAVPKLILALKDSNSVVRANAASALGSIGPDAEPAVQALVDSFKDSDASVRNAAADALGNIGPGAQAALPVLEKGLKDPNPNFRANSAVSLAQIGSDPRKQKEVIDILQRSLKDPDSRTRMAAGWSLVALANVAVHNGQRDMLPQLEPVSNSLSPRMFAQAKVDFDKSLNDLRQMQPPQPDPFRLWIIGNPKTVAIVAFYVIAFLVCFILLFFRPLWLWRINQLRPLFQPAHIELGGRDHELSLAQLFVVGLFHYHWRVLDAWVQENMAPVRDNLTQPKPEQHGADVYVSDLPVDIDSRHLPQGVTPSVFYEFFSSGKNARLLIWGEGGSGKTTLMREIARWAMDDELAKQLCKHRMLPVVIKGDLHLAGEQSRDVIVDEIRSKLKILTNRKISPSSGFVRALLEHQRILLMVDGLSEMNEATQNKFQANDPEVDINALVVTSRSRVMLDAMTEIHPHRLQKASLSNFVDKYMHQRGKTSLIEGDKFFPLQDRISQMVGYSEVTVLLAKLYLEMLISAEDGTNEKQLAENVPELMLMYLDNLNRTDENRQKREKSNTQVEDAAKAVAWLCLEHDLRPLPAKRKDVVNALGSGGEETLNYLEQKLNLIVKAPAHQRDQIQFALDPLAEYLAAIRLIEDCGSHKDRWLDFFKRADSIPGDPEGRSGFFRASLDCFLVKGPDFNVPEFVQHELRKRGIFDFESSQIVRMQQSALH